MDPTQIPPDVPLVQPPPGQTSDFAHPQDHSVFLQIIVTLAICVVLSTVAVLARVATRLWIVKNFGWDDGLAVLAMLLNFGLTVCYVGEIYSGLAFSNYNTSLRTFMLRYFASWTFWNGLFSLFLYFTFAAIKLSILMLYLRLLGPFHKNLRFSVWVLVGLVLVILIGTTAGLLEFCHPTEKLFRPAIPGTCNVSAVLFVVQAVAQVVTDLLILIPPIPVVWRINAPKARRFGFVVTLCIGLFVTGIGLARLGILITELDTPNIQFNIQYLGTYLGIFEINFALIAICIPALRQLFIKLHQTFSAYRSRKSSLSISAPVQGHSIPEGHNIRDKKKQPSSITQFVDGPYTELSEVAPRKERIEEGARTMSSKTDRKEDELDALGLRQGNGEISNAV